YHRTELPAGAPSDFVVIDDTGRQLGPVISAAYSPPPAFGVTGGLGPTTVAMDFNGRWLPVQVGRDSILSGNLFFTTTNCSGQAYTYLGDGLGAGSPFLMTALAANTLYYENGPPQGVNVGSTMDYNGACRGGFSAGATYVPVTPAGTLNGFTPPFSVQ